MNKIVAFIGSPNKAGKTAGIVNEIVRGAQQYGAEGKIYTLSNMNIKYCQGCKYCKKEGNTCCIKDDMQQIYEDFINADSIIIGSPIYSCQVSAQTKTLFDRFYALFDGYYKRRFNVKRAAVVYSQGQDNPELYSEYFNYNSKFLENFGLEIIDTLVFS